MKPTEQIAKEVIKAINKDRSELYRFIDFIKTHAIALKIAFRCDREAAWELLRIFLREFEKIGMYMRKYDERVDDIARKIKDCKSVDSINKRLEDIIEEAKKLKDGLEKDHVEMIKSRRKSKQDALNNKSVDSRSHQSGNLP